MWLKESFFINYTDVCGNLKKINDIKNSMSNPDEVSYTSIVLDLHKDYVRDKISEVSNLLKEAIDNNNIADLEKFIINNCSNFLTEVTLKKNIKNLQGIIDIIRKYLASDKLKDEVIYNNHFKDICKISVILPCDLEVHGGYLFELYLGKRIYYKPEFIEERSLVKKRRFSKSSLGEKAKEYFNIEITGDEDDYNRLCDLLEYIEYELFNLSSDKYNGRRTKIVDIFEIINKISFNLFESAVKEHEYYQYNRYELKQQNIYRAIKFLMIELTKDNYFQEYLRYVFESDFFKSEYIKLKESIQAFSDDYLSVDGQMQYSNDEAIACYYDNWIKKWCLEKDDLLNNIKDNKFGVPEYFEQYMMFHLFKLRVSTYLGYLRDIIETKYDFALDDSQKEALFELYSFDEPNLPNWKAVEKFFMDNKEQVEKVLKSGKIPQRNYRNILKKVKDLFPKIIQRLGLGQRTEYERYDKCYILSAMQLYWMALNDCEEEIELSIPYARSGSQPKKLSALLKFYDSNRTIEAETYLSEFLKKRYKSNIGLVKSYNLVIKAVIELNELLYDLVGRYPKDFTKTNDKEVNNYEEFEFCILMITEITERISILSQLNCLMLYN